MVDSVLYTSKLGLASFFLVFEFARPDKGVDSLADVLIWTTLSVPEVCVHPLLPVATCGVQSK